MLIYLRRGVPFNDEHHVCDVGIGYGSGERSDDCAVIYADGVVRRIARAAHVASCDGSIDKCLCGFIGTVGHCPFTITDTDCKTELVFDHIGTVPYVWRIYVLYDEHDDEVVEEDIVKLDDGSYRIMPDTELEDLFEYLEIELTEMMLEMMLLKELIEIVQQQLKYIE